MSGTTNAAIAAAFASVSFGAAAVVTRFVIGDIEPVPLAFLRYLIASLLLAPVLIRGSLRQFRFVDLAGISGLGVIFCGLFPWSFNAGLALIPASRAALWLATMPALTLLLGTILRIESYSRLKAFGTLLTVVGVAVALGDLRTLGEGANWRGDLLLLATACCGAVYFVLSRPFLKRLPALSITCISMIAGTIFLGIVSAVNGRSACPISMALAGRPSCFWAPSPVL